MKYELMALVNQIGREEYANGHDYMQVRMEKLYDKIAEGNVKPSPEEVGTAIFDQYFEHIQQVYVPIELPEENKSHNINYVKPFFDLDEFTNVNKGFNPETNSFNEQGYETFILELCDILDIKPKGFQDNMRNRMVLLKKTVKAMKNHNPYGDEPFFK